MTSVRQTDDDECLSAYKCFRLNGPIWEMPSRVASLTYHSLSCLKVCVQFVQKVDTVSQVGQKMKHSRSRDKPLCCTTVLICSHYSQKEAKHCE